MPARLGRIILVLWLALLAPLVAHAQPAFPALTGRVVDGANIIPPDEKARLEQKLAGLEAQSGRQLVVATLPDLQGYDIADYGYQLGRAWGIGSKEKNDGAILIVAPKERKVRIEVGYGLEGVLTDGMSSLIIQQQIVPRFKAGDMPGGIEAGTDAIVQQLTLPADQAKAVAASADQQLGGRNTGGGVDTGTVIFVLFILFFFVLPMMRRAMGGGRRYGGSGALGPLIVFDALSHMSGRRDGWGGGGGFGGGGGGGGFGGGGGSFGGGGASGSW